MCPQVIKQILNTIRVFPSPVFLHTNRRVVLPVAPTVFQDVSPGLLACWTQRDEPASRPVGNLLHETLEFLRPVRHHTAVDHYSWCQQANSVVANHGLTAANVAPSGATSIQLEGSMNSRNSSDLGLSSASRSTFRHTTLPHSTHGFQLHAVPSSFRSNKRPDKVASLLKEAPRPMSNQSHAQPEDGQAIMKFDTFQSFWDLSHAVRRCHNNCRKCARMSQLSPEKSVLTLHFLVCMRRQRAARKKQVDCEGAMRSCM